MATENTPEQVETPAPASTPAPAQVTETPSAETTEKLSPAEQHDALAAQLADPNWTPAKSEARQETTTEQAQAQTETETPAGEVITVETPTKQTPTADDELQGIQRPRLTDPDDQLIAALYKKHERAGNKITWAEAETRIKGTPAKAEAPTQTVDPLTEKQTKLSEINAKLKGAAANGDLYNEEVDSLNLERAELIADIKAEQKFAERDARSAQASKASTQQQTVGDAKKAFPTLGVMGSQLNVEANALLAEMTGSPLLDKPNAPLEIASMAAARLARSNAAANGTSFAAEYAKLEAETAPQPAPKVTTPPAQPAVRKVVTPASGAQGTRAPDKPQSDSEKFRSVASIANPREQAAELNALLYGR